MHELSNFANFQKSICNASKVSPEAPGSHIVICFCEKWAKLLWLWKLSQKKLLKQAFPTTLLVEIEDEILGLNDVSIDTASTIISTGSPGNGGIGGEYDLQAGQTFPQPNEDGQDGIAAISQGCD